MAASLTTFINKIEKNKNDANFNAQCIKLAASRFLKNKFKISNYKKDDIKQLCGLHPAFAWRLISLINKANKSTTSFDKASPSANTSDNKTISVEEIAQLHPNDFQIQLVAAGKASENRIPVVIQFLNPDKCNEATKNFFVLFDNYAHLISDPIELTQYESCIKKLTFEKENLSRSLLTILSDEEIIPINKNKNISSSPDILITTIHISVAKEVLTPSFVKVLLSFLGLSRNISREITTSAIIKRINDPQETESNKLDLIEILLAKRVFQRQYWRDLTEQECESLTGYLKDKKDVRYIKLYNIALERTEFLKKNNSNPKSSEQTNISDNNDSPIASAAALNNELIIPSSDEVNEVIKNSNPKKPSARIDLSSLNLEGQDNEETHSKIANNFQRTNSTNMLLDILYKNNFKTNNQDIVDAVSSNLSQNALSFELSEASTTHKNTLTLNSNSSTPSKNISSSIELLIDDPKSFGQTDIRDDNNKHVVPFAVLNNEPIVPSSDEVNEVIRNSKPKAPSVRYDLNSLHLEGEDKVVNHLKAAKKLLRTNSTNKLLDILYKNNFRTNNQDIADAVSSNLSQNALSLEQSPSSTTQESFNNNQINSVTALNNDSIVSLSNQVNEVIENSYPHKPSVRIDLSSLYLEGKDKAENHLKATNNFQRSNSTNKLLDMLYKNNFKTNNQDIVNAVSSNLSQNALSLELSKSSTAQGKVNNNQTAPSFAITLDSQVNTTAFTGKQALTLDQSKQTLTFEHSKQALTLDQSKQAMTLEQSIQALTLSSSNNALTLDSSSSTSSKKNKSLFIELSIYDDEIDEDDNLDCFALDEKPTFINENDSHPRCNTPNNNVALPSEFTDISPIVISASNLKAENNNSQPDLNKLQTQFKKTFQEIMAASEPSLSNINKLDNSAASISTSNAKDQTQLKDSFSQAALSISCDKEEKASLDNSESASDLSAISLSTGTPVHSPIKQRVN